MLQPAHARATIHSDNQGFIGYQELEHQREDDALHRPPSGAGGFVAAGPGCLGDDLLDPIASQPLVGGQRLAHGGLVTQGLGEDDCILGGQRSPLARGGRWRVRGIADDHHPVGVPGRHRWQVVGVVPGNVKAAGRDQIGGRAVVAGEQLQQLLLPLLGGGGRPFGAAGFGPGDVGEPHRATGGVGQERMPKGSRGKATFRPLVRDSLGSPEEAGQPANHLAEVYLHLLTVPGLSGSDIGRLADVPSLAGKQVLSWHP